MFTPAEENSSDPRAAQYDRPEQFPPMQLAFARGYDQGYEEGKSIATSALFSGLITGAISTASMLTIANILGWM